MNDNTPTDLPFLPVMPAEASEVRGSELRSGDGLGALRAHMPDDFTIEIDDRDVMMMDHSDHRRFSQSWEAARAELIRRGYEVMEWKCEATRKYKARCRKTSSAGFARTGRCAGSWPTNHGS